MTEVQLFSTCLAEEFFPEVNDAAATVLERLRLKVTPIRGAFCCGQVAFNEGMREQAVDLARRFLHSVQPGVPIVVPSGSCTSMLQDFLRRPARRRSRAARPRRRRFGRGCSSFRNSSSTCVKVKYLGARYERAVAYHPSCHLMRELRVRTEPMTLLSAVAGIRICELREREECCGFGGMFSVKFPHISASMLDDKMARIRESGAEVVVANDCGCLMQIGGGLSRAGEKIEVRHLAEVLAAR